MLNILYEDNHLLCIEKPVNVPVQEDSSGDPDVLTLCKAYLKKKYNKPGNVWLGLVHRLDRPVGGVMVFARTDKAASRLSDMIRRDQIRKEYLAVLDGIPKEMSGTLTDHLIKDHARNTVRVTHDGSGKKAVLDYEVLAVKDGKALVHILLHTGRPHQIRVQFASRGLPLVCDQRYHPAPAKGQIALYACRLTLTHPVRREELTVSCRPPRTKPWTLFEEHYYETLC